MQEKSSLMLKQENLELIKENEALQETVTKLLAEIDRLQTLPVEINNPNKIVLSTEQKIIEEQIERLRQVSLASILSIDETRALDILIKNKKMLEKNTPLEGEFEDLSKNASENELLRLAGNVENNKFRKRNKSKTGSKNSVE